MNNLGCTVALIGKATESILQRAEITARSSSRRTAKFPHIIFNAVDFLDSLFSIRFDSKS